MLRNKNALLIHPVLRKGFIQSTPDIGLGFLATALRRKGYTVTILDCVCRGWNTKDFARYIRKTDFGLVGIKVFSKDILSAQQMVRDVRQSHSDTLILLGGPHPSSASNDVLDTFPEADYAFRGEAENTLPALLDLVERDEASEGNLAQIPGLIFRANGGARAIPPAYSRDMDSFGLPAWDLINPHDYKGRMGLWPISKNRVVAPLHVVRGCKYDCRFCAARSIMGNAVRFRSVKVLMEELRMLSSEYGIREFQIIDDLFTADHDHVMEFCAALQRERLDMIWACPMGLRPDTLDAELLHAMKDAGCYGTGVGVESGSQRVLDFVRKGVNIETLRKKIELIRRETNWIIIGFFLIGIPTETREEMLQTIKFACSLPLDAVQFSGFMLIKGTALIDHICQTERAFEGGKGIPLESGDLFVRDYAPEGITKREVAKLLRKAHRDFFLSKPSRILRMITLIHSFWQLPRLATCMRMRMFS